MFSPFFYVLLFSVRYLFVLQTIKSVLQMKLHDFIEKHRIGIDVLRVNDGRVLLEYFPFEREVVDDIRNHQRVIIKKSRQMHLTTLFATYVAWYMLFNKTDRTEIVYCTNKFDGSKRFKRMVDQILIDYYGEEEWVRERLHHRATQTTLKNGNTIRVHSSNIDSMRGWSLNPTHMYIFDEAAYIRHIDDFIETLEFIRRDKDMKVIMGSTPNGFEGFHKLWSNMILGQNDYKGVDLPYHKHPRRDESWLEDQRKMLGNELQFKQEVLAEFLTPSQTKKNKSNLLQFRVTDDIMTKIGLRLIEEDLSISEYLRKLVKKDIAN